MASGPNSDCFSRVSERLRKLDEHAEDVGSDFLKTWLPSRYSNPNVKHGLAFEAKAIAELALVLGGQMSESKVCAKAGP
jgi:hypothetical protein